MEFKDFRNVHHMLSETIDQFGDQAAYRWILDSRETESITWRAFGDEVRRVGKSLIALGLEKGDKANIRAYAEEQGISGVDITELIADERIISVIDGEIQAKNAEFASFETIKKFRLVEEFTIENGLLTPTMKVKRNVAMERYAGLIESMYT